MCFVKLRFHCYIPEFDFNILESIDSVSVLCVNPSIPKSDQHRKNSPYSIT